MNPGLQPRFPLLILVLTCVVAAYACAVPLATEYSIEQERTEVHFQAQPQPHLEVTVRFNLLNSGTQELEEITARMPAESVYDLSDCEFQIGGEQVRAAPEAAGSPGRVILHFTKSWKQKERRQIRISYKFQQGITKREIAAFTAEDSFYLSPAEWLPVLLPPSNAYSAVRGPLKQNSLLVRTPQDFQVRASGEQKSRQKETGEITTRFEIGKHSSAPFVVAGRYAAQQIRVAELTVSFWTRHAYGAKDAQSVAQKVARIVAKFDETLGPRPDKKQAVWMIESPAANHIVGLGVPEGGRGTALTTYGRIPDTALLDAEVFQTNKVPFVAEKLIPSWTGFGHSLDVENVWPMTELNAYVGTLASLYSEASQTRSEAIFQLILQFQQGKEREAQQYADLAERKSFLARPEVENAFKAELFFFALEDRFGSEKLHKALRVLVEARRGQGYTLDDLIAALEQESRQSVAPFTRTWLKHPGLPEEFRRRYQSGSTAATAAKEGSK